MGQSNQEKYLGDVVDKSGKVRANIEERKAKGYGMLANIMAIINEVPLGHWKVDAGLQLRQAMLINGIRFNSEAWHNVSQDDLKILEKVDQALLRGILNADSKIPLEPLFLESSSIPIRFIVSSRRMMYLHHILQRGEEELIRKVYQAQKVDTDPGDFFELISEDKIMLGIHLSDTELGMMKKEKFKKIVQEKRSKQHSTT